MSSIFQLLKEELINTGVLSKNKAQVFFNSMYENSLIRCRELLPNFKNFFPTRQYTGPCGFNQKVDGWRQGKPLGICDHFTAGDTTVDTLKWFSSYDQWSIKQKDGSIVHKYAGASSEFVIGLDGEIFLLIPFWEGKSSWHEPTLNGRCLGIEHTNVGELRKVNNKFVFWPGDWSKPYKLYSELPPIALASPWRGAFYMMPYTRQQLVSNLLIKRALVCMYSDMNPSFFVGHSDFRDDKLDPGPLFPLKELRKFAFESKPFSEYAFFNSYTPVGTAVLDAFDSNDLNVLYNDAVLVQAPIDMEFDTKQDLILWVQINLKKLKYNTTIDGLISSVYIEAVRLFQSEHSLVKDGIAGPITRAKLQEVITSKGF